MVGIKKYLRLWWSFFKASFIADLEFRANFLIRLATDIFWYIAQVLVFEALYQHTERIGSWNLEQTRVFLGIVFVVDGLYMILFSENLDRMSERVRRGEMDLLLAKPVNSQFMLSTQKVGTVMLGNLCVGASYFIWALMRYSQLEPLRLLWLIFLIPSGLLFFYCVRFMFATMTIIFTKAENLQHLWYQVYRLGLRPDSIYSPWLKFVLLTVLPVGLISSLPARAVLDAPQVWLFAYAVLFSFFVLYLSHRFWIFCLRHYTSASS